MVWAAALVISCTAVVSVDAVAAPAQPVMELTANGAASRWDLAYPVGNGTMGAMSFGASPMSASF